ncbi:MAG: PepSY domain-containing protein [Clostridiales bacterium]|nr:PepSY domain-containing protein [Clostridiales bacterium]MDY2910249.1 PepSY domain-containing protein [Oscillospiraceae bacterium]
MNYDPIEAKLKSALQKATPDILDDILEGCDREKGQVISMEKRKNKKLSRILSIAAVFVLLIAGVFLYKNFTGSDAAALVSIDVNPSIELEVDADERIIIARALNDDGKKVLSGMKLEGTDLNTGVNAIVGSMLKNGYIDELRNSVLVSVSGDGSIDTAALEAKLMQEVSSALDGAGAVVAQNLDDIDDDTRKLAERYGISVGKAAFIEKIIELNPTLKVEELAPLSINELCLLANGKEIGGTLYSGSTSDKAYIGAERAKSIALSHASLAETAVFDLDCELDYEYGRMVYEVDFDANGAEYEYEIDAKSGDILLFEIERNGTKQQGGSMTQESAGYIGAEKAKSIALSNAGLTAASVTGLISELDSDDGAAVYEVEFIYGGYEYEYKIDAKSGAIIESDKEIAD